MYINRCKMKDDTTYQKWMSHDGRRRVVSRPRAGGVVDRRHFLAMTMSAAATLCLSPFMSRAGGLQKRVTRTAKAASVYQRLHAPLAAITVPFKDDYSVDYDALSRWVDFICAGDPPVLFFTYGDGEVDALTEEEIARINLTVAKQARGRALVVGATGAWWTNRTIDFVKRMEDGGLDAINVHFSHRIRNIDQLFPAFEQIAEKTEIPLLVYDDSELPTSSIVKLSTIPQVAGVKSHANLYGFYDQVRQTRDTQFAVLGAGQMKQYLYGAQVGSPGYLCPLAPVAPGISQRFYRCVQSGDWDKAREIIFEYEEPLMKETIPLGYPQAYKAMLHLAGLYATNLVRPPRLTPPLSELAGLRSFLMAKEIIKGK